MSQAGKFDVELKPEEAPREEWRAESRAEGICAMPKHAATSWQVYRKPTTAGGPSVPTVLLGLEMALPAATVDSGELSRGRQSEHFEMSREQLSSMLESLGKIKDRLSAV